MLSFWISIMPGIHRFLWRECSPARMLPGTRQAGQIRFVCHSHSLIVWFWGAESLIFSDFCSPWWSCFKTWKPFARTDGARQCKQLPCRRPWHPWRQLRYVDPNSKDITDSGLRLIWCQCILAIFQGRAVWQGLGRGTLQTYGVWKKIFAECVRHKAGKKE